MANWFSANSPEALQRVVAAWKDAPLTNVEVVGMLLEIAMEQVLEYAPADEPPADEVSAPTRYVWAQLQQAKHLWNAGRVAPGGDVGAGDFVYAPRPLDRDIQRIIRPTSGVPNVF